MKALILCGGFGTRYNLNKKIKILKPLVKIDKISILKRIMIKCKQEGIKEFILLGGYKFNKLKKYTEKLKEFKIKILYTGLNTDTAGRLLKAKEFINKKENFLFTYGDSFVDFSLKKNLQNKKSNNYVISTYNYKIPYGGLNLSNKNILTKFLEKKAVIPINAGFYILDDSIFSYIKSDKESFEKTTINKILNTKKKYFKCVEVKKWYPLDTYKDKVILEKFIKKQK